MGDLGEDTAVVGGDGRYEMTMSRDWEIWGPQGGYVASVALRAAGAHTHLPRPASIVGHFLGVASFDAPVVIECVTLRSARRAHSVRVSMSQAERPIFEALVWAIDNDLARLEHHEASPPPAAHWSTLPTVEERLAAQGEDLTSWFPFWLNFDQRPPVWGGPEWRERSPGEHPPEWVQWVRYRPTPSFPDPWVDACRLLVLVDVGSWPAAQAWHNTPAMTAPSIDLACEFHRIRPNADWLLVQAHSPSAADGLVASHQHVWTDDGTLLASGVSQLLCRPT